MSTAATPQLDADGIKKYLGILDDLKTQYANLDGEVKKLGKPTSETVERVDKLNGAVIELQNKYQTEATKKIEGLETQIKELAKRQEIAQPQKTIGAQFIEDKNFNEWLKAGNGQQMVHSFAQQMPVAAWRMATKDIVGLSQTYPQMQTAIVTGARLPYGVRQLVPQGNTTSGSYEYMRETSFTNNAAPVAEGTAKPKSDKTFETKVTPAVTIAHYFKVSRQCYEDLPSLAAVIENNGVYGVLIKEDNQLLNGTGVAPQIEGFMHVALAAPAGGTGASLMDVVGLAIFDLAAKGYIADGVVINPADWGAMAMMKNIQGNYLFANPVEYSAIQRMWGVRMVTSSNMAAGNFLAGAFQGNSLLLDRETVNVQVASMNEDDFIKNMLTVRVEERIMLLIYQPGAFEKGTIPAPAGEALASAPAESNRRR